MKAILRTKCVALRESQQMPRRGSRFASPDRLLSPSPDLSGEGNARLDIELRSVTGSGSSAAHRKAARKLTIDRPQSHRVR